MKLLPLSVSDKPIFERYLKKRPHVLSAYSFENIFIWRSLFELRWAIINKGLCLFFKNNVGIFMYFAPLGELEPKTIFSCFDIMEDINHNKDISRIENIEEQDLDFFQRNNLKIYEKSKEYIVSQHDIAYLTGEKLKHKRNIYNYFLKHYSGIFREYKSKDKAKVLKLYKQWSRDRMSKYGDYIYQAMLEDSFKAFSEMLKHLKDMRFITKVVELDGEIRAFTSGFAIARDIFCVNFEIADLKFKGLAQFIFSKFAQTLDPYPQLNIMDDCGFENIRKTKLSFRLARAVPSYTALIN